MVQISKYLLVILFVSLTNSSFADQAMPNSPHVKSSEWWGTAYLKSIPSEHQGEGGKTYVYSVKKDQDELLYTLDWYSKQLYLVDGGKYLVRIWPYPAKKSKDSPVISFYKAGKLLKTYTAFDIAENADGWKKGPYFPVIGDDPKFDDVISPDPSSAGLVFNIHLHGRPTSFFIETGEINRTQKK